MDERDTNSELAKRWEVIQSSGCSKIQDAIEGRGPEDFSPDMIRWVGDFVEKSSADTQAAPKPGKKK